MAADHQIDPRIICLSPKTSQQFITQLNLAKQLMNKFYSRDEIQTPYTQYHRTCVNDFDVEMVHDLRSTGSFATSDVAAHISSTQQC